MDQPWGYTLTRSPLLGPLYGKRRIISVTLTDESFRAYQEARMTARISLSEWVRRAMARYLRLGQF